MSAKNNGRSRINRERVSVHEPAHEPDYEPEAQARDHDGAHATRAASLIDDLFDGRPGLRAIAARHGVSLRDLASWMDDPECAASVGALLRLAEARTGMIVGRARSAAAKSLGRLALNHDSPETARKACVDLLKLDGLPAIATPDAGAPGMSEADDAALRGLLQQLGEAAANRTQSKSPEAPTGAEA